MAKIVVGLSGGVDSSYVFAVSDVQMSNSCGYEEEPEGGARCTICFNQRLEKTAEAVDILNGIN